MTDPLDAVDWPVRTERLSIRRAVAADAEQTWRVRALPGVSEWMSRDAGPLEAYAEAFASVERLPVALVVELHDGTPIGEAMLKVEDGWAQDEVADGAAGCQAELGHVLDPTYQGQGYATETLRALLRIAFADLGLRRVTGGCFAANTASWRVMERVGMRRELHAVRESLHRTLGWVDGYGYALLADEWAGGSPAGGGSRELPA